MTDKVESAANGSPELISVGEVLTRLSHEVRLLSDGANELQDLVGNLVVAGAFGGSPSIYELQCLDRLSQNLDAVSDFLTSISKHARIDWRIDVAAAAAGLKLAELGDRLKGIHSPSETANVVSGDFEDFALTG